MSAAAGPYEHCFRPAHELAALIDGREATAGEIAAGFLARAGALNPRLNAFITLATPDALSGEPVPGRPPLERPPQAGPSLAGLPVAVKDNMCTAGMRTTCGSRILEGFVPPYDATVVARLRDAGVVPLGKTNMDEFAMGSSNEHSFFGPARNPWSPGRVPGGSSGGAAAAVAAGMAPFALGSDTGGSVRQPASLCGVVGMKPTYGRVSRYGLVAFASSLDQIGPLTRDVRDCALVMNVIAGHDPADATSADLPAPDFAALLGRDIRGLRLGVPREYFGAGVESGVDRLVRRAIALLEEQGVEVEECSLPHTEYALAAYYLIAPAEASSNLARYDGVRYGYRHPGDGDGDIDLLTMYRRTRREGFGAEVKRRIMLGTYALSAGYYDAYYLKAQRVRTLVRRDFDRAFRTQRGLPGGDRLQGRFDALVAPTSPTVAFALGERAGDPLRMYMADMCTIPANLAGLPALSVPCGLADGLPVGLQFIGRAWDEATLLQLAHAYEQASDGPLPPPEIDGAGRTAVAGGGDVVTGETGDDNCSTVEREAGTLGAPGQSGTLGGEAR